LFEFYQLVDAVDIEPVSSWHFPANREKNREFHEVSKTNPLSVDEVAVTVGFLDEFPRRDNREYFLANRDRKSGKQGIALLLGLTSRRDGTADHQHCAAKAQLDINGYR
jgi:hypothetical protein